MNTEEFKRKLTAVLSADVEGYSRLMDDDSEPAHRLLGHVFQAAGQPDKAMAEIQRALAIAPNSTPALATMGSFLNRTGKYRETAKTIEAAIALDPFAPTWFSLV